MSGRLHTPNIRINRELNVFVCNCYERAIAEGQHVNALLRLGLLLANGQEGVEQDLGSVV